MELPTGFLSSDISVITAITDTSSSTHEVTYYHVPFLFWLVLFLITTFIANHVIWEFLRYYRTHHTYVDLPRLKSR